MMVSNDGKEWAKRYVIGKKYLAYNEYNGIDIDTWEYVKEIEELEISIEEAIEELAKLKGVDKSLIKIKL